MADGQYVIQEHTTSQGVHWDLMIEREQALMTFRLDEPPEEIGPNPVRAVHIFDHELRFLTYEGPVQKGTGKVRIVDRGRCLGLFEGEDLLTCKLQGRVLDGSCELQRTQSDIWQLTFREANPGT